MNTFGIVLSFILIYFWIVLFTSLAPKNKEITLKNIHDITMVINDSDCSVKEGVDTDE